MHNQIHANPRFASKPTGSTLFWRTFLPWQFWRFCVINLRMLVMISRSHSGKVSQDNCCPFVPKEKDE
ncbi:MAG: hypothetical protein PHC51_05615 [bacterium]|nr:hypothetical protein [bacterium]